MVVVVCGLATVSVTARVLGASDYGILALAMVVPQLVYSIIEARSGQAAIRYIARYRAAGRNDRARAMGMLSFALDSLLGLSALLISGLLAPLLAPGLLGGSDRVDLIIGYAVGVAFRGPIAAGADVMSALGEFRAISVVRSGGAIVRLATTIAFLVAEPTMESAVAGFVAGMAIEAAGTTLLTHARTREHLGGSVFTIGLRPLRGQRREIGAFIVYSDLAGLLRVLGTQADLLVLGVIGTNAEVGGYRLARQLIAPAMSLVAPLQSVLLPQLATNVEIRGVSSARTLAVGSGRRIGVPLSIPFVLGFIAAPLIVALVGGSGFESAVVPTRWFMVLGALWTATFWVRPLLFALGRVRTWTVIVGIGTAATITGFWILGTRFGVNGVAASRTLGMGVLIPLLGVLAAVRDRPGQAEREPPTDDHPLTEPLA